MSKIVLKVRPYFLPYTRHFTRSWFETAFDYKTVDFKSKFPCNELSVMLTALKIGVENIQAAGYNDARTVFTFGNIVYCCRPICDCSFLIDVWSWTEIVRGLKTMHSR